MGDGHIGRSVRCWLCAIVDSGTVACSHVDSPSGAAACDAAACNDAYAGAVVCNGAAADHGHSGCNPPGAHCYAPSDRW